MTLKQIIKLKPKFKFGNIYMTDWFTIRKGTGFCCIKSGLIHADGKTKSPYYFEYCVGGKNATKDCLKKFNEWYLSLKQKQTNKK